MMLAGDLRLGAAIAQRRGVTKWVSGSMVQCVPVVRQNRNHLKLPLLPIHGLGVALLTAPGEHWSASFTGTSLALRPRATVFPSSSTSLSRAAAHFGVPSTDTLEAIRLCARLEGMLTDPVYEGKSMQALIDMVARGDFEPGSAVLYVHLGGVPAMSAYSYPFRNG